MADYTIWARNGAKNPGGNYGRLDQIQDFQKLTVDLRWGDVSTWQLELPYKEFIKRWDVDPYPTETLVSDGYGLRGILIFRGGGTWATSTSDGNQVLSGVITNASRDWNGFTDKITLTGEADTHYMKTRVIYPHSAHTYNASNHFWWTDTGDATHNDWAGGFGSGGVGGTSVSIEYMVRKMTDVTMGDTAAGYGAAIPAARPLWLFSQGTIPSPATSGFGDLVRYWTRFESLYDMSVHVCGMQETVESGGYPGSTYIKRFDWDIVQLGDTGTPRLVLRFREPTDKTDDIIFGTELGNVKSFHFEEREPEYNALYLSGPNIWHNPATGNDQMASDQYFMSHRGYSDSASVSKYGEVEGFTTYNIPDAPTAGTVVDMYNIEHQMYLQARSLVAKHAYNLEGTMVLGPRECEQFMDDFHLGDVVTTSLNGLLWHDYISEIKLEVTPDGEAVTPTVCDPWKYFWSIGKTARASDIARRNLTNLQRRLS